MDTQKKPAGLRKKEGAALLLIAALLFGFGLAGCGEDPATADEIAAAVVTKEKAAEQDKGNDTGTSAVYATTLQSAFTRMLNDGSGSTDGKQSVTPVKALDGTWTQADAAYTVGSTGTNAKLSTSFYVYKDEKGNGQKSYTVKWKVKTAPVAANGTLNVSGSPTLTASKAGTKVSAVLDFQIVNADKRGEVINGTVTLEHTLSATDVLEDLVTNFEDALSRINGGYGYTRLTDMWAVKPLDGTWKQKDAKYTATMQKPSSDDSLSFANTGADWDLSAAASGFTVSGNTLAVDVSGTVAAKVTLKFALSDTAKVANETVEGTLVSSAI